MGVLIFILLVWFTLSGLVGYAIGRTRGRAVAGFWLGLLLGQVGWIIVALLARTPEHEASYNAAVARASVRITGAPHGAIAISPSASRETHRVLTPVRDAAATDPDSMAVTAAIDHFAAMKRPQRMLSDWFFASGAYPFVARYDGQVYACNSADLRSIPSSRLAQGEYFVDDAGIMVRARIDSIQFSLPRPSLRAERFLESAHARRGVELAPPPEPAALNPGFAAPRPVTSSADALRALQALLTEGLIEQDEYTRKRQEVIDRL